MKRGLKSTRVMSAKKKLMLHDRLSKCFLGSRSKALNNATVDGDEGAIFYDDGIEFYSLCLPFFAASKGQKKRVKKLSMAYKHPVWGINI